MIWFALREVASTSPTVTPLDNTLQREMDGSNSILFLCLIEVEKWFSHH
jgi:hypothetical protein